MSNQETPAPEPTHPIIDPPPAPAEQPQPPPLQDPPPFDEPPIQEPPTEPGVTWTSGDA